MISFIVPVYNTEKYISKCIDSMMNSGLDDFEIIIVNDGSTDESYNICNRYKEKYGDVINLINKENQGVSAARNTGLEASRGEWVVFVDSDDYLFEKSFAHIDIDKNVDLYIFEYSNELTSQHDDVKNITYKENEKLIDYVLNAEPLIEGRRTNLTTPWAKMFKKEIIDKEHLRFPIDLPIGEDMIFNINYLSKCKECRYVTKVVYHVEERENSASRSFNTQKIEHDRIFNNYLEDSLKKSGLFNSRAELYYDNIIVSATDALINNVFSDIEGKNSKEQYNQFLKLRDSIKYKDTLKLSSSNVRRYRKILFFLLIHGDYRLLKLMCKNIKKMKK